MKLIEYGRYYYYYQKINKKIISFQLSNVESCWQHKIFLLCTETLIQSPRRCINGNGPWQELAFCECK